LVVGGVSLHEISIKEPAEKHMELNYYLQTDDNMTHNQKYEVALLICQSAYDNDLRKLWIPPNKDSWVESNALELVNK